MNINHGTSLNNQKERRTSMKKTWKLLEESLNIIEKSLNIREHLVAHPT